MAVFTPDNSAFSYMGRIDFSDTTKPLFIYAASNVKCKFKGSYIKVTVENVSMGDYASLGALVDNIQYKFDLKNNGEPATFTIAENLSDGEHELVIFKRMGAAHYFRFISVETDGELIPHEYKYDLKLEVFGDSVSAGEVTEAIYYNGCSDPENHGGRFDNSYFGYPYVLSRKLNAELNNNSQGGIALFNGTGYFYGPAVETLTGLEKTYDKLSYVPYAAMGLTDWDFSRYTPDIVIFAIGQNDANPDPNAIFDAEYAKKWKNKYKEILLDLKGRYKTARFILITTVLMHDPRWDEVLDEIKAELDSPDVYRYRFNRNGAATPGHPRISEQEEMAGELAGFIKENIL